MLVNVVEIFEIKTLRRIKNNPFCNFLQKYVLLFIKFNISHN